MRVGTKSLIFGVHQVVLHPLFVARAWRELYGRWPSWRELICIIVHDWGYLRAPEMDGECGRLHPLLGASIAGHLIGLGRDYALLTLLHSRTMAKMLHCEPSRLCWADKLAPAYYPEWLFLLLGRLSGELEEYRVQWVAAGHLSPGCSYYDWFRSMRCRWARQARSAAKSKPVGEGTGRCP